MDVSTTIDCDAIDVAGMPQSSAPADRGGFCVMAGDAWDEMARHAGSVLDREVGGVLAGRVARDPLGRPFLRIERVVPALAAKSAGSSVTFTAAAWAEIHAQLDDADDGRAIVGWYHTHPNFGVFLSEMDLFIHEHFFAAPYQVAIVVDPIRTESGAFVWRGGALVREPIAIDGSPVATPPAPEPSASPVGSKMLICLAVTAMILLAAWCVARMSA